MIHLRDIAKTVVGILAAQFVMYLIVGWTSGTALPLEATFMVAFTLGIFILLAQALHDAWATRLQSPYPPTATVGNSLSEPSPENSWRVPIPVQTQEPPCGTSAVLTTTCATTEALA